jgi:hypothetical protein
MEPPQRLTAPEVAVPVPGQAADLLLHPALPRLVAAFGKQWHEQLARWRERQRQEQAKQETFAPAPPLKIAGISRRSAPRRAISAPCAHSDVDHPSDAAPRC